MIFAVGPAERGNICADTIQAFLLASRHRRGIVARWKKQGGYVSGNAQTGQPATFEQTKNCQQGNNWQHRSTKIWCESPLDMATILVHFHCFRELLEYYYIIDLLICPKIWRKFSLISTIHIAVCLFCYIDEPRHFLAFFCSWKLLYWFSVMVQGESLTALAFVTFQRIWAGCL